MSFWIIIGILMLAVMLSMLWPLLRRRNEFDAARDPSLEVYRDQLLELDRDRDAGRLGEPDHAAARLEVERRLLAEAADTGAGSPNDSIELRRLRRMAVVFVVLIAVPAASLVTYLMIGQPGTPDLPLAGRTAELAKVKQVDDQQQRIKDMVTGLAARLKDEPGDLEGWRMLARSYVVLQRYPEAADAYRRALGLVAGDADLLANYGEALYLGAERTVTPEALQAFEQVLARRSDHHQALYYMALGTYQGGDAVAAIKQWNALLEISPSGAPWIAMVAKRIETAAGEAGVPVPELRIAQPTTTAQSTTPDPTSEDVAAAQEMSQADRSEMIQGMVARLAERLKDEPDDLDGWRRLARAYQVLNRPEDSKAAHAKAAELAPEDPEVLMDYARTLFPPDSQLQAMPPAFKQVVAKLRTLAPNSLEVTFFAGLAAAADGDKDGARALWQSLLDRMEAGTDVHNMLLQRIQLLN